MTEAFVAARLADHRGRFARDGAFVDRGQSLDDLAVGGDRVAGDALEEVALAGASELLTMCDWPSGSMRFAGVSSRVLRSAVGLRPAAGFGDGFGEVGEEERSQQDERRR